MSDWQQPPSGPGGPPPGGQGQPQPGYPQPYPNLPQGGPPSGQPPQAPPPFDYRPPQGPPPGRGRRIGLIAVLLVAIAGLVTAGGLVLINRGDDDGGPVAEEATYVIMDTPAFSQEPVFEPRDARGSDPFFPLEEQLVTFRKEQSRDRAGGALDDDDGGAGAEPPAGPTADPDDFDVEALAADVKTGLYGGTAENTCDPERLIAFLVANPDLGEAWAQVQGITFAELPSYIRSLDVRVLAEPLPVLNHGYNTATKAAYEIDSVLDAGTAVLVDANGEVRARCYCGNPIRPKPPTGHKPPACLSFPGIHVEPGSSRRRLGAPSTVFLTNRQARLDSQFWVEVMWGPGAMQMGWTQKANVVPTAYCRPPRATPKCAFALDTFVYRTPNDDVPFGVLGPSEAGVEGYTTLPGLVEPVGGSGERTIANGRLLVHFWHPTEETASGWIDLSAIDETETVERCRPIPVCAQTGQPMERFGGAPVPGTEPGFRRIEVTGRFVPDDTGLADDAAVEVRLLDRGGELAWLRHGDGEVVPDGQCTRTPIVRCKRGGEGLDNAVYRDPTTVDVGTQIEALGDGIDPDDPPPPEQATALLERVELSGMVGFARDVDVTVIGSPIPTNGRVQVQIAGTGPIGWVDAASLDGDACVPVEVCLSITGPAYSAYRDQGFVIPGTPTGGPRLVRIWIAVGIEWPAPSVSAADLIEERIELGPEPARLLIELDGQRGWVSLGDIEGFEGDRTGCEPPPPPYECPTPLQLTGPGITAPHTCCVRLEGAFAPVSFTGRSRPGVSAVAGNEQRPAAVTEHEVERADGARLWVDDASLELFARSAAAGNALCGDQPVEPACPAIAVVTGADGELSCCAAGAAGDGLEFEPVELTGETAELNGETFFGVVDGDPIPESRFVNAQFCTDTSSLEPACPVGQIELGDGVCCADGQELVDGDCADPCPSGQRRQDDGSCAPAQPNPTATPRPTPRPTTGPAPAATSTPNPEECPDGFFFVGDGICCPDGFERIAGTTQCAEACDEGQVRGSDGRCRIDCPQGQLTLLLECCPSTLEPNGFGQCAEPCAPGVPRDAFGQCEPFGTPVPTTGPTTPSCPSDSDWAPVDQECCPVRNPEFLAVIIDGRCEFSS